MRQAAAPINQFTQQSNFLLAAMAGAERVFQAMDLEPEVDKGSIRLVRVDENGRETADTRSDRWAWREEDGVLTLTFTLESDAGLPRQTKELTVLTDGDAPRYRSLVTLP